MKTRRGRRASGLGAVGIALALAAWGRSDSPGATFDRERVPDRGRQVAHLSIAAAGRYAIAVASRGGVALQVVDRMAGPGPVTGEAGARDGRIDLFLDRGEVRVVARGTELGRGDARLSARPFRELHADALPRLTELAPVDAELGDLEQRSYWIEVAKRRWVVLEAAGRHLSDLRLWSEAGWLLEAEPERETLAPTAERPLRACRLVALLEPGRYRLTAYGGPEETWTSGDSARPLHLRWGIPRRGAAGRDAGSIGPLGYERFLVSGRADHFRLELPEAGESRLELADYDAARPFAADRVVSVASITKETVPPAAAAWREAGEGWTLATVHGAPGQRYVLQHLVAGGERTLQGGRGYWFGSVHAGPLVDSIDATGVLVAFPRGDAQRAHVERGAGVRLDAASAWSRRFNLLAPASLFVEIAAAGSYRLTATGAPARFRVEPLFVSAPAGYREPEPRSAPAAWDLDPGWYRMTLLPVEAGIVEVALRGAAAADPLATNGIAVAGPDDRAGAVRLGAVVLAPRTRYTLLLAEQPGVVAGAVVRELPLDLEDPLPVALAPGETIEIPARASRPSLLSARAEDGVALDVAVGAGPWAAAVEVPAGEMRVRVRSTRDRSWLASVGLEPLPSTERSAPGSSDPAPELAAGAPRTLDLERAATASFSVSAEAPSLYTLETTGLLATEATLRTRVEPRLASAAENGPGRNASLAVYLRAGEYRLGVKTRGDSAGHLGVALTRAPVRDGGELALGVPARATLDGAESLRYRLEVPEPGRYRVRALGLGAPFGYRVEDADGWPVARPVLDGDRVLELEAGSHTVQLLPRDLPARAVVSVERVVDPTTARGHGPHPLALDAWRSHVWTEPAEGEERAPDRFRFALPAATRVEIAVTDEMAGELTRRAGDGAGSPLAAVAALRPLAIDLASGDYELALACSRRNHLAPYRLRVTTADLVDGSEREVATPALLGIATDGGRETVLESFGGADVRARLYDADGTLVASSDDRPDDWNFRIGAALAAGRYQLRVDSVGAPRATTRISMRERDLDERPPAAGGGAESIELDERIAAIPLELSAGADLVAVGATAARPLALRLERRVGERWLTADAAEGREVVVAAVRGDAERWRLRLSTLDGRPARADWTRFAGAAPRAREAELKSGVRLAPLPGLVPEFAAVAVALDRAGCFDARPEGTVVRHSRGAGRAFAADETTLVSDGVTLWLGATSATRLVARRRFVGEEPTALRLAGGERARCDLASAGGAKVAVEAWSLSGQPGVHVLGGGAGEGEPLRRDRGVAFAPERALALGEAGSAVEVWNASAEPAEVRLSARAVEELGVRVARAGGEDFRLLPGAAERLRVPAGTRATVALDSGGAARFGAPGSDAPLLWSGQGAAVETAVPSGEIFLFNPTSAAVAARVELLPGAAEPSSFDDGGRFATRRLGAGALTLDLAPPSAGSRLVVRGARATLAGADGSLARGTDLVVPEGGGSLRLEHGPGLVAAWFEPAPALAERISGSVAHLELPTRIALGGEARRCRFEIARPALLRLRAAGSGEIELRVGAAEPVRELFGDALRLDLPVPAGALELAIAPLPGEALPAAIEATLEPLAPLAQGLGDEVLLAPGEARAYVFELAAEGPVGVGATSSSGDVETTLFDAGGSRIGRGIVLWRRLAAGRYVAVLRAPDEGAPARARPALVGTSPAPDGPPPEVVRAFVALAGGAPETPAGATVGERARRRPLEGIAPAEAQGDDAGEEPAADLPEDEEESE